MKNKKDKNEIEQVKIDTKFYKDLYVDVMCSLKAKVLAGLADSKDITLILNEIKRLEIEVKEADVEVLTSFVTSKSGKSIDLPFDNLRMVK